MKICCINPPIQDFYCTSLRRQPLGLLYIIAALEEKGHCVTLINGHSPKKHIIPMPDQFRYLIPFIETDDAKIKFPFKYYCHYGASFHEIARQISASNADIFFISCLFTTYYQETVEIISLIRKLKKKSIIVTGGYHASLYPEFYLVKHGVDYVIMGEGEQASVSLIEFLCGRKDISDVPNLCYRESDSIIKINNKIFFDIDSIPLPARRFLKERDFRFYHKKGTSLISSRGCPNRCDFCTSREFWGHRYRKRSVSSIINEIDQSISFFNISVFNFEDDNLMVSYETSKELLEELYAYQKRKGVALDFTAMNGLSLEYIDEEIIQLMRRAGFSELNVSLVSHSPDILKSHGRPFNSEKVRLISKVAHALGMRVRAYFILGLPDQTIDEINETIQFLNTINAMIFPSVYYNVNSIEDEWKTQRSSAFYNETQHLSRNDILSCFNTALSMNQSNFK